MSERKELKVHADPFGHDGQAKLYLEHRPRYPARFFEKILEYCGTEHRDLYVDVCTGTGMMWLGACAFWNLIPCLWLF